MNKRQRMPKEIQAKESSARRKKDLYFRTEIETCKWATVAREVKEEKQEHEDEDEDEDDDEDNEEDKKKRKRKEKKKRKKQLKKSRWCCKRLKCSDKYTPEQVLMLRSGLKDRDLGPDRREQSDAGWNREAYGHVLL